MKMYRSHQSRGYTLMVALVALAIVTSLGLAIVQQLARQHRQAITREEQVQCHWIAVSEVSRIESQGLSDSLANFEERTIRISDRPLREAIVRIERPTMQTDAQFVLSITLEVEDRVAIREDYSLPRDWDGETIPSNSTEHK